MKNISLVSENTIKFNRIKTDACISYKIYVKEYTKEDEYIEYLLDEIDNPKVSLDLKEFIYLEHNDENKWQLPAEATGSNSSSVEVYVNHLKLDNNKYSFNPYTKILKIFIETNPLDSIEVIYLVDKVEYIHKTVNKCEYKITPVFKRSHLLGKHTLL